MKKLNITIPDLGYQIDESFKAIRTNLQFCGDDIKAVTITSCTENEGKSTVTLRLAQSLAESGKNTVLVDADMRKSVALRNIDTGGETIYGLSHYLSGQNRFEDVMYATNVPKLYMIPTGQFPPNPSELLDSRRFTQMIDTLRGAFDYILIDTPPLASVIDAAIVAGKCDGSILVIESGSIGYHFAQDILGQLDRAESPILGVIINKADMKKGSKYYGKYYGKHYGKYYGTKPEKETSKS